MNKQIDSRQALQKLQRYCAYQERCHKEVKTKLYELGVRSADADDIVTSLILEGFLNEERFAKSFAGGKFRLKKWGRLKIVHALESKGLTKNCINAGIKEIDEQDYEMVLRKMIEDRSSQSEEQNLYIKRDKISAYLIQKGFEPELVWRILKEQLPG